MATSTLEPAVTPDSSAAPPGTRDESPRITRRSRDVRIGGLAVLLAGTAVLYLVGLSASGYANSFYSPAVQAGSQSWKAFFFGSLDAGNAITVDKPPASLWLMALSVRIFGLSSWSILVPQALLGVATVGVLYASVRRSSGHVAGLVAGAALALTPVAALMFRYNNPDALLVFLTTLAGYLTLKATERASAKTLAGAGVLIGFAFLTKMLQAFLVLPAFVLVYLIAARTGFGKRVLHLLAAFAAVIVSLGWWVAVVELVPASWRPYVGGSANNSILDLVFGYNGLGRIFGQGGGQPGGGGGGAGFGGPAGFGGATGITRLFDAVSGGMISWLIPAALVLGAVALVAIRRAPRTNPVRAAIMMWGGWLLVTGLTFSFMAGIYHDYYTVALAPAVAGLIAVAGHALWRQRARLLARVGLAVATFVTAGWAFVLLGRATAPYSTMRWPLLVAGVLAATGLLLAHRLHRVLAAAALGLALVASGVGPAAYAVNTAATAHQGGIVTAGPVSGGDFGGQGGSAGLAGRQGQRATDSGGFPGGGQLPGGQTGAGGEQGVNTQLASLLTADASSYTWVAATTGSQSAANYQLAVQRPVMAIGGFSGSDPSPTLAQFQTDVQQGKIHYFVAGGQRGGPGGDRGGSAAEIATWVSEHYTATTVGGTTVYDLTPSN
jgi:4-amino-4-deoxy-L-arabinose transferase-like glycosyltransferase